MLVSLCVSITFHLLNKHTSFLHYGIDNSRKKYYDTGPGGDVQNLFHDDWSKKSFQVYCHKDLWFSIWPSSVRLSQITEKDEKKL
jgi:hypothetical protein